MTTLKKPTRSKNSLPFTDLIEEYLADLRIENRSPATLDSYRRTLEDFARRMNVTTLGQVSPALVKAYQSQREACLEVYRGSWHPVEKRKLSPYSLHLYARNLKAFGSWLTRQKLPNPFVEVKKPKLPKSLIVVLTPDEIQKLFEIWNPETAYGSRWQSMLSFFLDTGVRVSELVNLTLDNLDMKNFRAKVIGKGAKQRYVFFGSRTHRLLSRYINATRTDLSPRVFVSDEGEAMQVHGVQQIVKRAGKAAGIEHLHPHLFRHAMATRYAERNAGDSIGLQTLLGHESQKVTMLYIHMSESTAIAATRKVSLMDDMEGKEELHFNRRRGRSKAKAAG